jgi:hypothetical protein
MGRDVPFSFETIQSGVYRTNRYLTVNAEFDLLPHRDPIGPIFEPQKRQDDNVLEFAQKIAVTHYLYNIEQTEEYRLR